jgi:small-conductance mechanosensitive channel
VISLEPGARRILVASLLAALSFPAPVALASQPQPDTPPHAAPAPEDPEATPDPAPVLLGGESIIWITTPAGPYTTQFRAGRISERLLEIVRDRRIANPSVTVTDTEGSSELRVGPRLLMVVTPQDARNLGVARAALARHYARELETAIRTERLRYAPSTLLRSGIFGLVATLLLGVAVWLILRLTRAIRRAIALGRERLAAAFRVQHAEILPADSVGRLLEWAIRATRVVLLVLALDLYLTYVLGLFPWTRAVSMKLFDYVVTPVRAAAAAFVGYLPKLLFVVVIAAIIYAAIRLVGVFFNLIRHGRIVFTSFPAEWADPTNKIVRVLLIAFGLVVAFPYLPASDSPAFTGVSVFMGVLISLASSSALSNMIAGIVLTYTNAFRLGDRVRVGETFGDIVETSLLATHVRTIKNEDVTLPNAVVLASSVINYSRAANTLGLILHTSVTIGYDAPWRKVHDLLIGAALATPGVRKDPPPFVWQTALNDFYVTYEINAYTSLAREMVDIYAALHARIQDAFYAAGVEIMSPHYTALRDGNAVAIPDALRSPEYRAPAFRVETTTPQLDSRPARTSSPG